MSSPDRQSAESPVRTAPNTSTLRCWAEIDLSAIVGNADAVSAAAPHAEHLMAIVKADAYRHGAVRVAQALRSRSGVRFFGVAGLQEARELQEGLGLSPQETPGVFILGPVLPANRPEVVAAGFTVSLSTVEEAQAFDALGRELGEPARAHLTVDTGMGRMGFPEAEFPGALPELKKLAALRIEGLNTHFPDADGPDSTFTSGQIERFRGLAEQFRAAFPDARFYHLSNSAGILRFGQDCAGLEKIVRPGLALYGVSPVPEFQPFLRPALSLKTRVALVRKLPAGHPISYGRTYTTTRPTLVATLGIGYGDGYPRQVSNRGTDVLISGRRCPLLGRVTMDQVMADVTDLPRPPEPGDEAVLLGRQGDAENAEEITATELAEKAGTISWDILTGLTSRVTRIYVGEE